MTFFDIYICSFFCGTHIVSFSSCDICKVTLLERHFCPSVSVVLEVKGHVSVQLDTKEEIPDSQKAILSGVQPGSGLCPYSSIFQEIILSHRCHSHHLCLHGFRNSEHVKIQLVRHPCAWDFGYKNGIKANNLHIFICKVEEWVGSHFYYIQSSGLVFHH